MSLDLLKFLYLAAICYVRGILRKRKMPRCIPTDALFSTFLDIILDKNLTMWDHPVVDYLLTSLPFFDEISRVGG